ncbi:MAG: TadE/TadG family type IV pilus assembly protein [Candidatus Methanomethyliaceae archaeon]
MRYYRTRQGQSMIELTVVLPIFVLLLFSIITFGAAVNSKIVASGAAREAARNYAIYQNEAGARNVALTYLKGGLTAGAGDVVANSTVEIQRDTPQPGYVTVIVSYKQPTYVPLLFSFLGDPNHINVVSTAVFKIETN